MLDRVEIIKFLIIILKILIIIRNDHKFVHRLYKFWAITAYIITKVCQSVYFGVNLPRRYDLINSVLNLLDGTDTYLKEHFVNVNYYNIIY